jgi:RNA polymerase sigma factor (sigma-70 family)
MIGVASRPQVLGSGERVPIAEPAERSHADAVAAVEASHGQALFGFVRRLGLGNEHAQDAVQEAFLRLWQELERGTVIADPKAWAYRTVYRIAMDEHRLRRRVAALVAAFGQRGGTAAPDATDRIAVWREVDRLPMRQRQVVYLRYRADLAFEEIAAILGITSSAARSHGTQAMQALRRQLADGSADEGRP